MRCFIVQKRFYHFHILIADTEFMLRWIKKIGTSEIPVAVNHYLEHPYDKSKRHDIKIDRPGAKDDNDYRNVDFKLTIKG